MSTREETLLVDILHNTGDFEASATGDLKRVRGQENLKQALNHRLITVKGSLVHRPEYGVGAQNFQGALTTIDKKRELALNIIEQFARDSRVEVVDGVSFQASDDEPDKFLIFVKYSALGYNELVDTFDPFELGV